MNASQGSTGSYFRPNSPLGWAAIAFTALSVALLMWVVAVPNGESYRSSAPAGVAGALAGVAAVSAVVNGDRNLTTYLLTIFWGFVFLMLAAGSN